MDNTPIVEIDNMRSAPDYAAEFAGNSPFAGVSSDPETGASVSTRYRRAEISDLARSLLMEASGRLGTEPKGLEDDAASLLAALPWRGRIAELRSVIEILAVTVAGPLVRVEDVLSAVRLDGWTPPGPVAPLRDAMRRFEQEFVAAALARHDGRIGPTAKTLGLQRQLVAGTLMWVFPHARAPNWRLDWNGFHDGV
jgi:hypothetical protein